MKLIKSCLRNRLYIETLDALMMISMVGPEYVCGGDETVFDEALTAWQGACTRNPRQARFGNKNACKRRAHEVRTSLPVPEPDQCTSAGNLINASFELDELADLGEDGDENVFCGNGSTADLVEPYKPVVGFVVAAAPPAVSNQYLKVQKIAYKFQTEWLTRTFRGKYKGKKDEFKGHYVIYFDRKNSFHLELNLSIRM